MALLRTLQSQWINRCWSDILEMLELSDVISLHHLMLIRVTFRCWAIWKMVCSRLRFSLNWIEGMYCTTHSGHDTRETSISYRTCCFSISICCRKWWIAYWTHFTPFSRNLKTNLMDAFYAIFGLRTVKNRFYLWFLRFFLDSVV